MGSPHGSGTHSAPPNLYQEQGAGGFIIVQLLIIAHLINN